MPSVHGPCLALPIEKDQIMYMDVLKSHGIEPNWWCSEEYFEKAGWVETSDGYSCCVREDDGTVVLPPIRIATNGPTWANSPTGEVWAGLATYYPTQGFALPGDGGPEAEFLDYNFIYDPLDFATMPGKKWATFRKNCRKYQRRSPVLLSYIPAKDLPYVKFTHYADRLLNEWLPAQPEIEDAETIVKYVYEGQHRMILIGKHDEIHGINIWDENYYYTNFRYCICCDRPYLSEFMRYLFYMYINRQSQALPKPVNDGGSLGRESLKKFKMKLNPTKVVKVYSWKGV